MTKLLQHTRRPDISFHRNGTIRITARVAHLLSLQPGDVINIMTDNGEFLLHASRPPHTIGRHQGQCYPTKKGSHNFCANSVRLCRALLDAAGIKSQRAAFIVGEPLECHDTTHVPIITKHPL